MIDSVFRTGNNHYPQVFLEECKYVVKERNTSKFITGVIKKSSDSDRENSDKEISNEENSNEENLTKKIMYRM